jgi:hypothetical protein
MKQCNDVIRMKWLIAAVLCYDISRVTNCQKLYQIIISTTSALKTKLWATATSFISKTIVRNTEGQ